MKGKTGVSIQHQVAPLLSPTKLCACLLICYLVKKQPENRYKLSLFLLKQIKEERDKTWKELLISIDENIPESEEIINWLIRKIGNVQSPDCIDNLIRFIRDNVDMYFSEEGTKSSPLGSFLHEMLLIYDRMFFDGLSRLFLQTQRFYQNEQIIQDIKTMDPKIYLESFLEHKQSKNISMTIDELHRYFDYQLCFNTTSSKPSSMLASSALSLAATFYEFGNISEGMEVVREALRLAQESSDDKTLVKALYWLFCFLKRKMKPQQRNGMQWSIHQHKEHLVDLLGRCIHRAKEHEMTYWFSLTLLAIVELLLNSENNLLVNMPHLSSTIKSQQETLWTLLSQSEQANSDGAWSLDMKYNLLRSSVWNHYGHRDLSLLYTQLSLPEYQYNESSYSKQDSYTAFCKMAFHYMEEGNDYDSFKILTKLYNDNINGSILEQENFLSCTSQLLVNYAIRRGNLIIAESILKEYSHDSLQSKLMQLQILYQSGKYQTAIIFHRNEIIPRLKMEESLSPIMQWKYQLTSYLLISKIYLDIQQPSLALSEILNAHSLCLRYNLHATMTEIILLEAYAFFQLKQLEKSINLLDSIFSQVMYHSPARIRYELHLLYAKVLYASIPNDSNLSSECSSHLEKAQKGFIQLENLIKLKEVYYYQSLLYNHLQNIPERDNTSKLFIQTEHLIQKRMESNINKFDGLNPSTDLANTLLGYLHRGCQ